MEVGLEGVFLWIQTQAKYGLMIALIILILVCAVKRAWIAMVGALIGLAFVGIFILNPDVISSLAEWLGSKLNMS